MTRATIRAVSAVLTFVAALVVPVGTAAPAAAAVTGVVIAWSPMVPWSSATVRSAVATCPAGKVVIGAVGITTGAEHDVVLEAIVPSATSVWATAREDQDGTTAAWHLWARAVCADPVPGRVAVTVGAGTSTSDKSLVAACPAGTTLLTHGFETVAGWGEVQLARMEPSSGRTQVSYEAAEDQDGHDLAWSLTAHLVCAPSSSDTFVMVATSPVASDTRSVTIDCGAGNTWTTTGWTILGYAGSVPAGQTLISNGGSGGGWSGVRVAEDDDGFAGSWRLRGRLVCVRA